MKNVLLISLMLISSVLFAQSKMSGYICEKNVETKSTQSDWAMSTNFVATDLDGVEHNLQTYLDAGKYVIVDVSCTWCGPCFSLHQTGVFEDLYNTYGPAGTDELVVLWVEVDPNTTLADIEGTTSATQGDWTNGGEFPVPIINDHLVGNSFSELATGYVPEVYVVCPSGAYKIITDEAWNGAAAVYGTIASCPTETEAPEVDFTGNLSGFVGADLSFADASFSVAEIISWNWTFESGTPATASGENATVQWDAAGTYDVTLTVANATGENSITKQVTINEANADDYHVTFEECIDFAQNFAPYNWTTLDVDATVTWGWNGFDYAGEAEALPFIAWNNAAAGNPEGMEVFEGSKAACAIAANGAVNNDWLISPLLTIEDNFSMTFQAKSYISDYGLERIKVGVSTTDNQPESFTFISSGDYEEVPITFTEFSYDLSSYAGQDVYLAIQCVSNDASLLLIDNVYVETSTVGIENNTVNFGVYPNPSNGMVNISNAENANVKVLNNIGQVIISRDNISKLESIDMSEFESGSYIINIEVNNASYNKHLVLTK